MSMSRRTRKSLVGKAEDHERRERERHLLNLLRELRHQWRRQRSGQGSEAFALLA
jgi:hypothetical protein